jgi:hypothetical protein
VASHRRSLAAGARDPTAARSSTAGPQRGSGCSWDQVPHRPCAADHRARRIHRGSFHPHQSGSRTTRRRRRRPALELAVRRAYSSSSSRDRAMETTVVTVHPRFVWGRRPRANGGRRRPRGRAGFYKYPPVISRGSYPVSVKAPLPPAPVLEEVMPSPFPSPSDFFNRSVLRLCIGGSAP